MGVGGAPRRSNGAKLRRSGSAARRPGANAAWGPLCARTGVPDPPQMSSRMAQGLRRAAVDAWLNTAVVKHIVERAPGLVQAALIGGHSAIVLAAAWLNSN